MTEPQAEENYNKTVSQEDLEFKAAEKFALSNPENLPPQFQGDPQKFLESYRELRKTLTKTQQELSTYKKPKETPTNAQSLESQQVQETAPPTDTLAIPQAPPTPQQPSQEEWDRYGDELRTTGNLSGETREKIRKKYNIPDSVIEGFIEGARQRSLAIVNEASKMVGGNDQLKAIIEWSQNNLTEQERNIVNQQLSSPTWKTTLLGLQGRMQKETPNPTAKEPQKPTPPKVTAVAPQAAEPFMNRKDMSVHIRDPRYGRDQKYTDWVQARILASGDSKWKA